MQQRFKASIREFRTKSEAQRRVDSGNRNGDSQERLREHMTFELSLLRRVPLCRVGGWGDGEVGGVKCESRPGGKSHPKMTEG